MPRDPASRRLSIAQSEGRRPVGSYSGVGVNVITTPVNAMSNSSSVTVRGPSAGSFRYTRSREKPSTTRK